jgi:hypothetical protein
VTRSWRSPAAPPTSRDHRGCFTPPATGQAGDVTAHPGAGDPAPCDEQPRIFDPDSGHRDIKMLRFDPQRQCWVSDYYDHLDEDPENWDHNPDLTSPDDPMAAQQWIRQTRTGDVSSPSPDTSPTRPLGCTSGRTRRNRDRQPSTTKRQ